MAITRSQQAKQMLQEGGRLGYRFGSRGYQGSDASTGKGGASKGPSSSGGGGSKSSDGGNQGGGGDDRRESYITDYSSQAKVKGGGSKKPTMGGAGDEGYDYFQYTKDNRTKAMEDKFRRDRGLSTLNLLSVGVPPANTPSFLANTALDLFAPFRNFSLRKNIDYFKGLKERGRLADYDLSAEGYKAYMQARLAGDIDAAGNPITRQDDDPIIFPENKDMEDNTGGGDDSDDENTQTGIGQGLALRFRKDGGRINAMDGGMMSPEGGIMDLETGRQMYFLGKLVKKATRAVKKVAKSPIGKAALLYAGTGGLGNLASGKAFFSNFMSPTNFLAKKNLTNIFTKKGIGNILLGGQRFTGNPIKGAAIDFGGLFGTGGKLTAGRTALTLSALSALPLLFQGDEEEEDQTMDRGPGIDVDFIRNNPYNFLGRRFVADGGIMRLGFDEGGKDLSTDPNYKGWKKIYESNPDVAAMNENHKQYLNFYERNKTKQAEGSKEPVAKKTLPLLDMDGKEMDLREDGGFVPIGRMERADDVPARLSKNEFVFTADAVRNAGDGDVDKGAEVMYNMMKNLESGGEVSEESQGLQGAREMFQTSKRLEEVL